MDDLHNVNDVLRELEGMAIKTTQGQFIKLEDVRRLIEKKQAAEELQEKEAPHPKTIEQARSLAKQHLANLGLPKTPPRLGSSIPASESQPSSRT